MKIVLASKSPRRRELLSKLFEKFEIVVAPTDESLPEGVLPREGVELLACRKGEAAYNHLMKVRGEAEMADTVIISSDTLVALENTPLGKPKDEEDAVRMLKSLSGREHFVHTGVAVRIGERVYSGVDTTSVVFREIEDYEINSYVKSGEPMDKAGSYGIQGEGGKFVKEFCGNYDTVVGLSMNLLQSLLEEIYAAR